MLANRSKGCRTCHDFEKMQASSKVSDKAKNYHRVMQKVDRTCVDCHAGVAHRNKENFKELLASGVHNLSLDLFYPAKSDGDWLLAEHAGAQQLRQGRNCRQCHYNEAKELGLALAPKGIKPSIPAKIRINKVNNNIQLTVSWQGSINDNSVAVMYDNGQVEDFTRMGCWATCHGDLPDMSRDRGLDKTKYLLSSLKQQYSVGFPAIVFDEKILDEKRAKGEYVELLRASLDKGKLTKLTRYEILTERKEIALEKFSATAKFANGKWVVTFIKPINNKLKFNNKTLTLGIAIHRDGESQGEHKVSLPVTVSLDGVGTDFMLK
jgi:cytochrome c-type protein NapC